MKKITSMILAFCLLLAAAGCNDSGDKKDDDSSASASQVTSESESENSSEAEDTDDSEISDNSKPEDSSNEVDSGDVSTSDDSTSEDIPSETEIQILNLEKETLYEYEWSDEYGTTLVETEYSSILLSEDEVERYGELANALSTIADAQQGYLVEEFDMLKDSAQSQISDSSFAPLKSTCNKLVRRADSNVLSILVDSYYYDGIFDSRGFWGENYDTETGEEIYLPDVVTDIDGFAQVVEDQLISFVGADVFYNDNVIKEYFEMYGADGTHWTLDYNGITIYFGEGEIANPGFGAINVTVSFAEHPEIFNEKYTAVPESYIVALPIMSTFYTDLDSDGSFDELTITADYDEEFDWNATIYISTAEVYYAESFLAYDCEPYYIKTPDGKNYIYLFAELETQMYLYVYEISNELISKVGEANVTPFYNDGLSAVLTDPENMHFDIFSDEAGGFPEDNAFFSVGTDGMPSKN